MLPSWAQEYFIWHAEVRAQFPDTALLTDPRAPKVAIQICHGGCGGTHDRLGKVENFLAFASLTKRIVLWKWTSPLALEAFVEPNICNWTAPRVPEFEPDYFLQDINVLWSKKIPLQDWIVKHGWDQKKILRIGKNIPNGRGIPAKELQLNQKPVLGAIFRSLFRPSTAVQAKIDAIYKQLSLSPGNYTTAHCRVRHPGLYGQKILGKEEGKDADESGLVFEGEFKENAIRAALMGVKCSARLKSVPNEAIYFMSDSDELVDYVVNGKGRTGSNQTEIDLAMTNATTANRVVARNISGTPTLHIDRQKGFPAEYYLDTFVDLYIAVNARCVSYGVGNFGYFASKISGTSCRQVHNLMPVVKDRRKWNQQGGDAPVCRQSDVFR